MGRRRIGSAMSPGRFDRNRDTSKRVWVRAAYPMIVGNTTSIRNGTMSIGSTIGFERRIAAKSLPMTARTAVQSIGSRAARLAIAPVLAEPRFDREVHVLECRYAGNSAVHGHLAADQHGDDCGQRFTVADAHPQTARGRLGRLNTVELDEKRDRAVLCGRAEI